MKPRQQIGSASVPGGGELRLFRRGDDFMILLDNAELMSSRMSGSEEALAKLVCARLEGRMDLKLLIGGYGMGFTLRAALCMLPPEAMVTVVELVPEVFAWARGPLERLTDGCLDDARVSLAEGDVAAFIDGAPASWDGILLDVDNGPDGLTRRANNSLYSARGLASAKAALKPGGILAIWSAAADPAFTRRLKDSGFSVEEVTVRARQNGKGPRHTIWLARPS